MPSLPSAPSRAFSESVVSLLRLELPEGSPPPDTVDDWLRRFECGGYLYRLWRAADRLDALPTVWGEALVRAHRKTSLDNLAALAEFRTVGHLLAEDGVPFLLLKGGAYLIDLYEDPGERVLTDIDLLVRRDDVDRLKRRLETVGYETVVSDQEFQRFEVRARGRPGCHFEFHWWLGRPLRSRIPQAEIWSRAIPGLLEGISCRRLAPEDALLYHVAHQADHLFGPTLKWTLDLREMLARWRLDSERVLRMAKTWRLRVALAVALRHLEKLFPGSVPAPMRTAAIGSLRGRLLAPFLTSDPAGILAAANGTMSRFAMHGLLMDRPIDVLRQSLRVLARPIAQRLGWGITHGSH